MIRAAFRSYSSLGHHLACLQLDLDLQGIISKLKERSLPLAQCVITAL